MQLIDDVVESFALGVNDAAAPTDYQPQEVQRLINARVTLQGNSVKPRGGSYSPRAGSVLSGGACWGGIEYTTAAGVVQWVLFLSDEMYTSEDEGATWTQRATSLPQAFWSLAIYREGTTNVLVCANGGTNTYQWDGSSWSTVANIPNNVKYLAVMGDRLIASGHSGVDVVASRVSDIDNGYGATSGGWSVKATTHDGDTEVRGLYTFGSVVLVFKKESVGYIEGFGYQTLQVEAGARGVSRSIGLAASFSIAPVGESAIMWLSEQGWVYYSLGAAPILASGRMQSFVDSILWEELYSDPGLASAVWNPRRREYWCLVPVGHPVGLDSAGDDGRACHYIFVFRPPTPDGSPASMWCFRTLRSADTVGGELVPEFTLDVDSNGRLCLEDRGVGVEATFPSERLALCEGGEYGVTVFADDPGAVGRLGAHGSSQSYRSLFVASYNGRDEVVGCGITRPYVLDVPGVSDHQAPGSNQYAEVWWSLRSRPFLFGPQALRKKLKRFFLQSGQAVESTVTVRTRADGVRSEARTLTMPPTVAGRPAERKMRVGGRGYVHDVELSSSDPVEILGLQVSAEPLRKSR